jgi:hypothetical protein
VGCIADHRRFLRRPLSDQLADHDQTGRDADPRRQRLTSRVAQVPDRSGDGEPGPHRTLRLVLVRLRPTEIGQHAVTHVLGNVAIPAPHHFSTAVLIGANDFAHVLRVELGGQRSRTDQIDEHHRELPAFCLGRSSCLSWSLDSWLGERGGCARACPQFHERLQ